MRNHTAKRILSLFLIFTVLLASLSYSAVAVHALEKDELDSVEPAASQKLNISFTYQHYIDTYSFPQSTHYVHIAEAVSFTNIIYLSLVQFGEHRHDIGVRFSSTGSYLNDTITNMGACTNGVNQPCIVSGGSCGAHSQHHKSVERISQALYDARDEDASSREFSVLWCDRASNTFCTYDTGFHEQTSAFGMVVDNRPVLQVLRLTGDDSENTAAMSIILAHETAHCLRMNDVYGSTNHERDGIYECLMDYLQLDFFDINDLYDEMRAHPLDAFCESCENVIGDLIMLHFYY